MTDYNKIPFAAPGDMNEIKAGLTHRMKVVREFMGEWVTKKSLDIGESNKFSRELGIQHNTRGDLNHGVDAPGWDYEVVTCYEVIEHLMNPLLVMKDIHGLLVPGGRCFVSTPLVSPFYPFLQSKEHLTEYRSKPLRRMFEHAGFEVVKYRRFVLWDWWFMFYGVRPFFRVLFHRHQLWELKKPENV